MTALLLQTLLLMVPAFFLGAALACGLRKLMHPARDAALMPARAQPSPVEPLPQYAARSTVTPAASPAVIAPPAPAVKPAAVVQAAPVVTAAAAVNRFDETLRTRAPEPVRPSSAPPVSAAPVAATLSPVKVPDVPVRPAPPPPPAPVAAPRPAAPAAPVTAPVAQTADMVAKAAAAMAATTAAVTAQVHAAAAKPAVAPAPAAATVVVAPPTRDSVVPGKALGPDDLTRISVIDQALSAQLNKLGVTKFGQIAAWRKADVDQVAQALGFQGRIEQENWIEQAQILAGGGETFYSARRVKPAVPATAPVAAAIQPGVAVTPPAVPRVAPVTPVSAAATTPRVEERAAFAQPSAPRPAPIATPSIPVPPDRVVVVPSVTPPAPVTPTVARPAAPAPEPAAPRPAAATAITPPTPGGIVTPPVRSVGTVVPAAVAAAAATIATAAAARQPSPPAPVTPAAAPPAVAATPAAVATVPAAPATTPPAATAVRPAMAPVRDNLQRIGAINGEIEKLLSAQGVTRYTQIAGWGPSDIERFDRLLGSQGRIVRENWVEQAQILAKGGDTARPANTTAATQMYRAIPLPGPRASLRPSKPMQGRRRSAVPTSADCARCVQRPTARQR